MIWSHTSIRVSLEYRCTSYSCDFETRGNIFTQKSTINHMDYDYFKLKLTNQSTNSHKQPVQKTKTLLQAMLTKHKQSINKLSKKKKKKNLQTSLTHNSFKTLIHPIIRSNSYNK